MAGLLSTTLVALLNVATGQGLEAAQIAMHCFGHLWAKAIALENPFRPGLDCRTINSAKHLKADREAQ